MTKTAYNRSLHWFALFTAVSTLLLIALGGLVTSHEAGMSVPDWPTTYGYNMFLFPVRLWTGGIFYEHTHRLMASGVGVLTIVLAVCLWLKDSRAWVKPLGAAAVLVVSMQGVLGGLRVVLSKDQIGVFHAAFAQFFLLMLCSIALFTSKWWMTLEPQKSGIRSNAGWRWVYLAVTLFIFAQLLVGATMRHQHAGLAIQDFPLAYGKLWPATDAQSIESYNNHRVNVMDANAITAFQVILQMTHRIMAYSIFLIVASVAWFSRKTFGARNPLAAISLGWFFLLMTQVLLGAATIWSNKAADIATAHVVVGAISLATGAVLTIVSFRVLMPFEFREKTAGVLASKETVGFHAHAETVSEQ